MTKPVALGHDWSTKNVLRCRCSKTASALILSLFLRAKKLLLTQRKFTFSEVPIVVYFHIVMMSLLL